MKPILCLDFDGVIHGYSSGWKGARTIPDAPANGALEFIDAALKQFRVAVFSSRGRYFGGRRAMKAWLKHHFKEICREDTPQAWMAAPQWWRQRVAETSFADPWPDELEHAASKFVKEIEWPLFKPSATISIDDRALTFTGSWPSLESLRAFKPWNKS
jgi:hypothetical protein